MNEDLIGDRAKDLTNHYIWMNEDLIEDFAKELYERLILSCIADDTTIS